jgi:hypothetical protein
MKKLHNTLSAGLLAVSTAMAGPTAIGTLTGCEKPGKPGVEGILHSHHRFINPDEMIADCSKAIATTASFNPDGKNPDWGKIVCEEYLTGSPTEGGFRIDRKIGCDEIAASTREKLQARFFIKDTDCYKPNFKGWPTAGS